MHTTTARAPSRARIAVAVGIGNFMEWFDFAVYGFFAAIIGELFFPPGTSPFVALLSSLAVFAVGFVMRPLGGFVLGPIGDRFGRRMQLAVSVVAMGTATTLIGVLPDYAAIGVAAPCLLVLLRCVQGLSAGGEWTGSAAFLVESTPTHRRGIFASVISGTAALATIAGSLFALFLNSVLTEEQILSWGWRVPFLMAAPLALIGLYIRSRLSETPVFEKVKAQQAIQEPDRLAVFRGFRRNIKPILLTLAIAAVQGLGFYYLATYVVNYLISTVKLDRGTALGLAAIGLFVYMILCPVAGALSDRFGRRRLNIIGTIGYVVLPFPVFLMMSGGDSIAIVAGISILSLAQCLVSVTTVVMLVELFPASTRASSSALGFNFALAFIAGPGPFIAAWIAGVTGSAVAPAGYQVLVAAIALVVIVRWLPETAGRNIAADHAEDEEHAGEGGAAGVPADAIGSKGKR
ncbi:citrate-proton symporter citrate transporter [Mycolicibacterium canariasense]|uniref:Putative proline/betaine transporter n=1 Tax=Mycolicibacterium canariasense TaxID=228230 RepID=A0A117ICE0_MYCCR|nr:MFS transporter [Mycolicibacterium canariasense]GAS99333.1 citrate-proton symporter citrate transporter [Mycolicibacterium canariasense]